MPTPARPAAPDPDRLGHPALRLLAERARRGDREDGAVLALGIEGGGLAVSMAAGMALELERRGLTPWFDAVYGASSGALVAAYAAAGRMEETATILPRTCTRRFVDLRRLARRRPVVALDFLLDLIRERPPVPAGEAAAGRPDFRALVVGVEDGRLRTLRAFATLEEELAAIRAAMSIPVWAGAAAEFRGELVSDGGLIESIPVHTPLAEGATHVVVLRSRDAAYRKGARGRLQGAAEDVVLNRLPGRLPDLVRSRPARYDAQADELVAAAAGEGPLAGRALQIAPDPGTPLVARLDVDRARVLAALEAGRAAAERALSPR